MLNSSPEVPVSEASSMLQTVSSISMDTKKFDDDDDSSSDEGEVRPKVSASIFEF